MKQKTLPGNEIFDTLETPLGRLYLIFSDGLLTGVSFDRPSGLLFKKTPETELPKKELREYFAGERRTFSVKLTFPGSPFEQQV